MLLLYMEEAQAFRSLVNLLAKRGPVVLKFFTLDTDAVGHFVSVFNEYFKSSLPSLHRHMTEQSVSSEMFLIDWNLTIFSKALSLESAARVWDGFLFDGESFVVKTALGILRCLSTEIRKRSIEEILPLLARFPGEIDTETLMKSVSHIRIARQAYEQKLNLRSDPQVAAAATSSPRALFSPSLSRLRQSFSFIAAAMSSKGSPRSEATAPAAAVDFSDSPAETGSSRSTSGNSTSTSPPPSPLAAVVMTSSSSAEKK